MGGIADWPGAHAEAVAGIEFVVGRLDAVAADLPPPPSDDLIDAGRRRGEQLRLFLRRRAALRLLVGRRLGTDPAGIVLGYDKRGAPVVRAPAGRLRVSVSARGECAGFALAPAAVGIDLEPLVDPGPIDVVLTPAEREAVAASPDKAMARLLRWTAKEAYLKALGTGLSRDPAGIEIACRSADIFAVFDHGRPAPGSGHFRMLALDGPLLVALWTASPTRPG